MMILPTNEKKGITVKIDAELHAEVRQYLEKHEMTMGEFVTLALQDELHPRLNITEAKNMEIMRTLAFQVPEELFHKIKDYLQRNNMSQKDFVIGLIETEIERDLTQRAAESEAMTVSDEMTEKHTEQEETAAVSGCERILEDVGEEIGEEGKITISDDFDYVEEEYEPIDQDKEMNEEQETENMALSMGM